MMRIPAVLMMTATPDIVVAEILFPIAKNLDPRIPLTKACLTVGTPGALCDDDASPLNTT